MLLEASRSGALAPPDLADHAALSTPCPQDLTPALDRGSLAGRFEESEPLASNAHAGGVAGGAAVVHHGDVRLQRPAVPGPLDSEDALPSQRRWQRQRA